MIWYSRNQSLLYVSPHLFASHHYNQLGGQLNQTATRVTLNLNGMRQKQALTQSPAEFRIKKEYR